LRCVHVVADAADHAIHAFMDESCYSAFWWKGVKGRKCLGSDNTYCTRIKVGFSKRVRGGLRPRRRAQGRKWKGIKREAGESPPELKERQVRDRERGGKDH